MTGITETTTSAASRLVSSTAGKNILGKDDFLKLLVSQLQNQDPLNPSDPTQFTAQLAQFSSLEQLSNVNQNLEKLAASQELGALSFIGREVVAEKSGFHLGSGSVQIGYRLAASAEEVTLYVRDGLGRTVATLPAADLTPGEHFMAWNGKDANGQVVPAGDYQVLVSALRGQEEAVEATALVKATVTGVDLDASGNYLVTEAGDIPLSEVQSVRSK